MTKMPLGVLLALCLMSSSIIPGFAGEVKLPISQVGTWQRFGRVEMVTGKDSVTLSNGWIADLKPTGDCEMTFRARSLKDSEQVQIWAAIRVKDRDDRYVVGLRGGAEAELSLARYAPEGKAKFLAFAPLNFKPMPGEWYRLRVAVSGNRFHVYLNDETLPRINAEDKGVFWTDGGVGLGGGWLPAEFADVNVTPLAGEKLAAFKAIGDKSWQGAAVNKETERLKQRAAYTPARVDSLPETRGEVSLNGQWLFMPAQNLDPSQPPVTLDLEDKSWHVIPVPSFWTPTLGWLHGETGMHDAKGLSASKGPSDQLAAEEDDRVRAQTFDWSSTKSGWYRHYLDLPTNVTRKQFELVFDAIAKISEVWVNGVEVGSHTGMFGEVRCDITKAVKPGHNVIAVKVIGTPAEKVKDADKTEGVAVTVEVTNEMLRTLPHGMTPNDCAGIWQPVKLVVTNPVRFGDMFIQPRLDGANAEVELLNGDSQPHSVAVSYAIRDNKDGTVLNTAAKELVLTIPANGKVTAKIETPKLQPKLWSPKEPNLYVIQMKLAESGKVTDQQDTRFGFRTFVVEGSKFLLNGKPYWLRGGNHFPATLKPNDAALAHRFMELAREGNVMVTRSHGLPFTETWMDAADEIGMGVSFEGTWPWLMLKGEPPPPDLLKVWKDEFASLLRKYRNHPSLLFWTVNNEMNFAHSDENKPDLLKRKWAILDDMIRTMRQIDPTRPICAYSGYRRSEAKKGYKEAVVPNKFDDGDIDDAHHYYGWYYDGFFHLVNGEYGKGDAAPNRPLISQEMSTGYPRNDDWPSRSYEFYRYVPQALVGQYAFEQNDPSLFMSRQAFTTKELAEVIRRTNRDETAGVLHFAYLTWFTDVWKADRITPKVTYYELKKALQPVLVSAELFGRHFYAGDTIKRRVCLVNDSEDSQEVVPGRLTWEIRAGANVLGRGSIETPRVAFYTNVWLDAEFKMPSTLPEPKVNAKLVLRLESQGKTVSQNDYGILLASRDWAAPVSTSRSFRVFDPQGKAGAALAGLKLTRNDTVENLNPADPLVIGDLAAWRQSSGGDASLKQFIESGGFVLVLQGGEELPKLFPEQVKSFRATHGEIVSMRIPESPVFDGIEPLDLAWFEMGGRNVPYACSGTYRVSADQAGVVTLADQCEFHSNEQTPGAIAGISGSALIEIRIGRGRLIASEMMLSTKGADPVAGRLLRNLLVAPRVWRNN